MIDCLSACLPVLGYHDFVQKELDLTYRFWLHGVYREKGGYPTLRIDTDVICGSIAPKIYTYLSRQGEGVLELYGYM